MFWALQEVVPTLCKLRLGSAYAITSPSSVRSAGHLWLISCCQHLHAWIPYWNGDLHSYNVGPLSCPALWHHHHVPAAGHSQSCSQPGRNPHSFTQHPSVASSTARLGPGGDIRVQEGWGGTP